MQKAARKGKRLVHVTVTIGVGLVSSFHQCDKQKPRCKRCINLGRHCPGYPDEWSSICRIQNKWAEKVVRSRVELKIQEREQKDVLSNSAEIERLYKSAGYGYSGGSEWNDHNQDYLGSSIDSSAPIYRSPFIGPDVYTINHFYDNYVLNTEAPLLDFLPELYSASLTEPCLDEVVPAVALANSAMQLKRCDLMLEARKHYGRAIMSLNSSLQDREEATSDGVLLTVFLLGLFEVSQTAFIRWQAMLTLAQLISADKLSINHGKASGQLPLAFWNAHTTGGRMLLRLRGTKQFETHVGRNLFILMNLSTVVVILFESQMRVSANCPKLASTFMLREEPAHELYLWTDLPQSWIMAFALEDPIYQAAKLCAEIQEVLSSKSYPTLSLEKLRVLLQRGNAIEVALKRADGQLPERWPAELVSAEHMNAFNHLGILWGAVTEVIARNQYRTMRIHVLQALSELLRGAPDAANADLARQLSKWRATIAFLVDRICDDTWIVLGAPGHSVPGIAIRAYLLLWPLSVAISADGVSSSRKQWIRDRLRWIGDTAGFGYASTIADMTSWDAH